MITNRDEFFANWPHQWFGLWKLSKGDWGNIPTLEEIVDEKWMPEDMDRLLQYLRDTPVIMQTTAPEATCSLCGNSLGNSSAQISDGKWVWPQPLEHFVRIHHVRIPDRMVEHIRHIQYRILTRE